jgi:sarcosine oxidase
VAKTGGLDLAVRGSTGEAELRGYAESMDGRDIPYELLDADEVRRRHPQFRVGDDVIGLHQADGGILDVRKSVATHVALARAAGADVRGEVAVEGITTRPDGVEVVCAGETVIADQVIVCAGAWTRTLLRGALGIDLPVTLTQEQVSYFSTPNLRELAPDRFPIWIWHGDPVFYGFPVYGEVATKAAIDLGGPFVDLEARDWPPEEERIRLVEEFLAERIPAALGPRLYSRTCLYDMPPDRDFVVDRLPGEERVLLCIGAGHAAKFAGILGRILADLALHGETAHPIEAFRADRPAMTDPSFQPRFRLTPPSLAR